MNGEYLVKIFNDAGQQIGSKEFDTDNDTYARAKQYIRDADGTHGDIYIDNGVGQASYFDTVNL